jgi:hypothetical protein
MEALIFVACGIIGLGIAKVVITAGRNIGWL